MNIRIAILLSVYAVSQGALKKIAFLADASAKASIFFIFIFHFYNVEVYHICICLNICIDICIDRSTNR